MLTHIGMPQLSFSVNVLDEAHVRSITVTMACFDDACVPTRPVTVALGKVGKQLVKSFFFPNDCLRLTSVMQCSPLQDEQKLHSPSTSEGRRHQLKFEKSQSFRRIEDMEYCERTFARVTILSATRLSSFAFGTVVRIRSCWINCVTIVRNIAHRCELVRLSLRKVLRCRILNNATRKSPKKLKITCALKTLKERSTKWGKQTKQK